MASISKRGKNQYQALIRRKGYPVQTRTFNSRRDAEAWAATLESEMCRGLFLDRSEAERTTFGELLTRYLREVTPDKRGWRAETSRIRQLLRHPLAQRLLATLKSSDFAAYRDERLAQVSPKTVPLDLATISAVLNVARRDWSIPVDNPIGTLRKPRLPPGRERRLDAQEEVRLLEAARESRVEALTLTIVLAIETGMRRGEIASLTWQQIDLQQHVIRLEVTKNGDRRVVPLTEAAEAALRALPRPLHGGRVCSVFAARHPA